MLIKVKVMLPDPSLETTSRDQFWRAAAAETYYRHDPERAEREIKERLPDQLRERLIAACRSEAAWAEATKTKASILPLKRTKPKPSFDGIEVHCLTIEYGSIIVWLSVKGIALIKGAMGADLSGVAALVQTIAIGVTKEVLSDMLGPRLVDALGIDAQGYPDAPPDAPDSPGDIARNGSAAGAVGLSAGATVALVALGLLGWMINAYINDASKSRGELQQTVQAFFTAAQEHAKSVGQLEVELIKARGDLLKTEGDERTALLKTDGEERTALHKLLVDAVKDAKPSTKPVETGSDKTELILLPPSPGCCAASSCRQVTTPTRVVTQPTKICAPSNASAKTGSVSAAK